MPRYKLTIEYDGTQFFGFQKQAGFISVQELLETSLLKMTRENVIVFGSGRTDTGVHAKGQVVHFDLAKHLPPQKLLEGLNYYMKGKGCCVIESQLVRDDFHSRFDAKERLYRYVILNRPTPSVFEEKRAWHIKKPLDIELMEQGAKLFLGHHDFKAFRSSDCQSKTTVKTLNRCDIEREGADKIFIYISSRSFLHNQVRIMVGTLVEIGLGKKPFTVIAELLENKDRTKGGITAPSHGLYFTHVSF
jgi:tRNA pseudouridine38-40 synthase